MYESNISATYKYIFKQLKILFQSIQIFVFVYFGRKKTNAPQQKGLFCVFFYSCPRVGLD